MEKWRYRGPAVIGLVGGVIVFLFRGWMGYSERVISTAMVELAGTAFLGTLLACAAVMFQRQAVTRANIRHDEERKIRIGFDPTAGR